MSIEIIYDKVIEEKRRQISEHLVKISGSKHKIECLILEDSFSPNLETSRNTVNEMGKLDGYIKNIEHLESEINTLIEEKETRINGIKEKKIYDSYSEFMNKIEILNEKYNYSEDGFSKIFDIFEEKNK